MIVLILRFFLFPFLQIIFSIFFSLIDFVGTNSYISLLSYVFVAFPLTGIFQSILRLIFDMILNANKTNTAITRSHDVTVTKRKKSIRALCTTKCWARIANTSAAMANANIRVNCRDLSKNKTYCLLKYAGMDFIKFKSLSTQQT